MNSIKDIPIEVPSNLRDKVTQLSKGEYKTRKLHSRPDPNAPRLAKPNWIRTKLPASSSQKKVQAIKDLLRENRLSSVCEEASCPNLPECFSHGTATFMVMGDICTRKCPFCDVKHGRPDSLDIDEPINLAKAIAKLNLNYVVITSVDRDDLKDGGAKHFTDCVRMIRKHCPTTKVEILTPDFRRCEALAIEEMSKCPPDVFNHNLETVPSLYHNTRPGADYHKSLQLIKDFKQCNPEVPTKSGIMVGLGETDEEIIQVMRDLRAYDTNMLTIGQYLQPSRFHLPVKRYVHPDQFNHFAKVGNELGFANVASGPMVRSSYHADLQASMIH